MIGCAAVLLILGLLSQIAYRAADTAGQSSELIGRAQSVLLYSENISVQLDRLDLQLRRLAESDGLALTDDFRTAQSSLNENMELLELYAADKAPQLAYFSRIRQRLDAKLQSLGDAMAQGSTDGTWVRARLAESEDITSSLHTEIRQLQRIELADLSTATFGEDSASARARYAILLVTVGAVAFLIIGASLMIGDQRRRRQLMRDSRVSEDVFRTLTDSAPVGILMTGPNGEVEFMNHFYASLTGLSEDDFRGRVWTYSLQPDDGTAVTGEWERAVVQGGEFEAEYRSVSREGRPAWVHARFTPLRQPDGSLVGFIGTATDLTERRRSEAERYRFFDLSQDLLSTSNFAGHILRVNPAWSDRLGFTTAELTSMSLMDLVHTEDREATRKVWARLMVGGSVTRFENRVRTKDGLYRRLSWNATADVGEELIYAIARDVTESVPSKPGSESGSGAKTGRGQEVPRILIVEPDQRISDEIVDMLAHNAIRTDLARTGAEALEMATNGHFNAIVLDLALPDMDGTELLDMVRRSVSNIGTPVVAILSASDRNRIPDLHIQGFVEKPVDLHHLSDALWRAGLPRETSHRVPDPA